jgi:hypothetical protein
MVTHRRSSNDAFFVKMMTLWGLPGADAEVLWDCLPVEGKSSIRYRIDRLLKRRPLTPAGEVATMQLLACLNAHAMVQAVEAGMASGQVDQGQGNGIIEMLLSHMNQQGEWK